MATYQFKQNDNVYDVESLDNVFTVAQHLPAQKKIIISYLDDSNIIKTKSDFDFIRNRIKEVNKQIADHTIVFENLGSFMPDGDNSKGENELTLIDFARRFGIATRENLLNTYEPDENKVTESQAINNGYYPVKDTDTNYDENVHGRFFGYNTMSYDMTIIAKLMESIPTKLLDCATTPIIENDKVIGYRNTTREEMSQLVQNGTLTQNDYELINAQELRRFNNLLFSDFKDRMVRALQNDVNGKRLSNDRAKTIYDGWLLTNRHVDVARLREGGQMIGLKRLAGMLGMQIIESDLVNDTFIKSIKEMAELLAYNVSDILCTGELFMHKIYQNNFNVKSDLLTRFPQVVYKKHPKRYEPHIDPHNVDKYRATVNTTSAKFVTGVIAPYNKLQDAPCISFMYPETGVAKRMGVEPFDVLEASREWAIKNIPNGEEEFQPIYDYYSAFRWKNANDTLIGQTMTHPDVDPRDTVNLPNSGRSMVVGVPEGIPMIDMEAIKRDHNPNWFYRLNAVDANGKALWSTCMVTFSNGGIHGQEIDQRMVQYKLMEAKSYVDALNQAKQEYPDAETAYKDTKKTYYVFKPVKGQSTLFSWQKVKVRALITTKKSGQTEPVQWREFTVPTLGELIFEFKWTKSKKGYALRDIFKFVSNGKANHEDFTSYYPLLLSRLGVFVNPAMGVDDDGNPIDPYYGLFEDRVSVKAEMGKLSTELDEKLDNNVFTKDSQDYKDLVELIEALDIEQNSKKLLLNSASGEADSNGYSNIRVNNKTISMRIIGQLFAWRIGQAQTLQGARVPSTNTDGLYTLDIEPELNDKILKDVVKDMYIGIEPERLSKFVTKDSNNRLEMEHGRISTASGGTLGSYRGATPMKTSDHPTITDTVLANYLAFYDDAPNRNFDRAYARQLLVDELTKEDSAEVLRYFQWIIVGSTTSNRYPFLLNLQKTADGTTECAEGRKPFEEATLYNRVFLINKEENKPYQTLALATAKKVTPSTYEKRIKNGEPRINHDVIAERILNSHGYYPLEEEREEASITKINHMPQDQAVLIENSDLRRMSETERQNIIKQLDLDSYLNMVQATFESSWLNLTADGIDYSQLLK